MYLFGCYITINPQLWFLPNLWVYMKINEKIRFLRESKSLTQDEMADRLGMSTNGYAKIERGETRLTIPKLEQIVEVFDTDILELMSLGERNVVYFQESGNNHSLNIINPTSQDLASEIIQLKQTISHQQEMLSAKNELIALQKSQLETLQKMVEKLSQ